MTLERIEHKVFASEAPLDEMGQFGSALATTKLNTKDVAEIQALPAYTKGWGSAIISENNYPAMEEMNGVLNVMSYHTGYLYQEGIPTYSATQEYSVTSWVKDLAGEKVYKSLQGGNKGHDLTDPAWWMELKLGGGGLEIGDIGIAPLGIDETKGKRRYLNGQLIIQEQYVQFTNKVKSAVALYPSLACTESEWQTTVTMTVGGQVGKFVVDDDAGTIRLPKIIMPIQGLTDLSKLAEIVKAGLPNITGLIDGVGRDLETTASGAFYTRNSTSGACSSTGYNYYGLTFDASLSNPIYGNSDTVQQEQIQYPYFIQVATGAETEDNIINEIELNNPFSLLDYKFSEYELNNLSWLRSNGQYNSKAIYPAVYDLLLKIYNGTETKAGVSVKLSTGSYTDYDFVLNTAEETFRLPKLTTNRVLVAKKEATASDLTWYNLYSDGWCEQGGMFTQTSNGTITKEITLLKAYTTTNYSVYTSGDVKSLSLTTSTFNGQYAWGNGGSAYGAVFWRACGYAEIPIANNNLYFYVGETVQNANLINAGRIEEKLVDKVDKESMQEVPCIVETYVNGTSWYRVWSDGWCEQGGYGLGGVYNSAKSFSLLKNFSDTNYNVQLTCYGATGHAIDGAYVHTKTTNSFSVVTGFNATAGQNNVDWYACGY